MLDNGQTILRHALPQEFGVLPSCLSKRAGQVETGVMVALPRLPSRTAADRKTAREAGTQKTKY